MKIEVRKSFEKDVAKIDNKEVAVKILALIEELESFQSISEIPHLKKMTAHANYYRIRVGDYRIGMKIEKGTLVLLRLMNRKDIYKYFP